MKNKILIILIVISLILEGIVVYHLFNSQDEKIFQEVKITDMLNNKKQTLAVMVQQEDNTWKEAENRNAWPSSTTHGFVGSRCYDGNGALVESSDIINFDLSTYTATINTTSSIYCTLYFAKGTPALDLLQQKGKTTFASGNLTAVDGMYRFKGTSTQVLNNYICFGTTLEKTCTDKSDTYLYRIIGITSEADATIGLKTNQLKIIKTYPLEEKRQWHSSQGDVKWDNTTLKNYLNTTFYNATFVTEATKIPDASYWESMISSHKWYIKDQTSVGATEPKDAQNISAESKIGLMYATDYFNAHGQSNSSWLFITNEWGGGKWEDEWTMTRLGKDYNGWMAWLISTGGRVTYSTNAILTTEMIVRPVFYLQSGVNLTGEGTKEHPFIISGLAPDSFE